MSQPATHTPAPVHRSEATPSSAPVKETESSSGFPFVTQTEEDARLALENAIRHYEDKRDCLSKAINSTSQLLADFSAFNADSWLLHYPQGAAPHLRRALSVAEQSGAAAPSPASVLDGAPTPLRRNAIQRAATLADVQHPEPLVAEPEQLQQQQQKQSQVQAAAVEGFQVLNLDLNLGRSRSSVRPLVMSLEKASIANLLDGRLKSEMKHLEHLQERIHDTASKVLVTGDLNAGKSTFVNALLRREVLPVDEQPSTTSFCAVHDARDNAGIEEAHISVDGKTYDCSDESTFTRIPLEGLEALVCKAHDDAPLVRVYVSDTRSAQESLIHNGVVDIALIDAPGLNRDSLKTTAVFARQDEIDVVVFVVNAANHFTLSAKEFIWTASNEKAYLFIVINRFDQIKDKERCKRTVLEQVRQLSPRTYEDAEELVHFVDSASIMESAGLGAPLPDSATAESFEHLEAALRSFVLEKRAKSKLLPAQTFVSHLLADLDILASANVIVAQEESAAACAELARTKPVLDEMKRGQDGLERGLETIEDESTALANSQARDRLRLALGAVGRGVVAEGTNIVLPPYSGLFDLWEYTQDVKVALLASLDAAVALAEDDARAVTVKGVSKVASIGDGVLPKDVERPQKVFKPEVMFSRQRARRAQRPSSVATTVGLGQIGGIALVHRHDIASISLSDLFDIQHSLHRLLNPFASSDIHDETSTDLVKADDTSKAVTTLGFSALGAIGLVSGKTVATRSIVEMLVRIADLIRSPVARRWAGPVVAVCMVGVGCYVVSELPHEIPRRVGRSIKSKLEMEDERFAEAHAERCARETKRVLRAAAWEMRVTFNAETEKRGNEVRAAEAIVRKAEAAVAWFEAVQKRTEGVRFEGKFREQDSWKEILPATPRA